MQTLTDTTGDYLTETQVARYWEDGFLFPIDVMAPAEAMALRGELEQIESDWRDADLPLPLPLPLTMYKRVNAHTVIPMAANLARNPRVLDAVESILGPNLMIWVAEFFIKEPRTPQIVGMHQDLTYWGFGETSDQVTAWIALSPATVESGCMDFVAGSHKNPILPHNDTFSENNLLSRGEDGTGNFTHVEAPDRIFAPAALERHARIRADQAKALTQGAGKSVSLYHAQKAAR